MADKPCICHVSVGDTEYEVKDSTARALIKALETQVNIDFVTKNELANDNDILRGSKIKPVVLWENATPTSDFPAQTVSITNILQYKKLLIRYRHYKYNYLASMYTAIFPRENNYFTLSIYDDGVIYNRNLQVRANDINFAIGKSGSNENNASLIPLAIYGIKE